MNYRHLVGTVLCISQHARPACEGGLRIVLCIYRCFNGNPKSKVHGVNMRPTWALTVPDGPLVGPMNLDIREGTHFLTNLWCPGVIVLGGSISPPTATGLSESVIWLATPWQQGSWDHHGAHLEPTGREAGSRWAPCWAHKLCYLGLLRIPSLEGMTIQNDRRDLGKYLYTNFCIHATHIGLFYRYTRTTGYVFSWIFPIISPETLATSDVFPILIKTPRFSRCQFS